MILNFKKVFGVIANGLSLIISFSVSVAVLMAMMMYRITKEIELHNHINVEFGKNLGNFVDVEYKVYLLNMSNPFLLGSRTMGLKE